MKMVYGSLSFIVVLNKLLNYPYYKQLLDLYLVYFVLTKATTTVNFKGRKMSRQL